jgi:carbamoyltransferase
MNILGISTPGPNAAAALCDNRGVVAAIEEEKLTRLNDSRALPQIALQRVLAAGNLRLADVDSIALAVRAEKRPRRPPARNGSRDAALVHLRQLLSGRRFIGFDHHLCHAASAFYTSDFSRSLVLTLDHGAGAISGLLALGEDDHLKPLHTLAFPNSFGWFYSLATQLAGLRPQRDEHKLQWLSKDGQPEYLELFRKVFTWNSKGLPALERRYFTHGPDGSGVFSPRLHRELGLPRSAAPAERSVRAALARSAQEALEEFVLRLSERFRESTRADSLCLAGGVFQNVLLVRALEQRSSFRNVYVQPVAGNAGTSLGAAFLARKKATGRSGRAPLETLALGPEPTSNEIKSVLDNCKIVYRYSNSEDELLAETSGQLEYGKIVGWCQGRTEFGHRALGNRSLLASPFNEYVLDNVNQFIKHREEFHPFALSVPAERSHEFFDCGPNCRFMASLGDLKSPISDLQRFTFNGAAVRVHTVEKHANPLFWKLLHRFGEIAPAPILVNTSFNLFGEPLVTDPRSAVRSFYCSGVDALAIGPFLVVK